MNIRIKNILQCFYFIFHSCKYMLCISVCMLSHIQLFVTPWTVAHQTPLSMGFSKQGH